jgi:UDP-3-O-[3-hydroxymyristoyl] glucosamine N-acyltransferase
MSWSLGELAVRFGCELRGDPGQRIDSVASLASAASHCVGFATHAAWREALRATRLAAVVVTPELAADCPTSALVNANPHVVFARIAAQLHPRARAVPGRHPSAVIDPTARIDATAEVGAFVMVGAGAVIGARCRIGPHCIVGDHAQTGADTELVANVMLCERAIIGADCILHPGVVIGSDGFGNARGNEGWVKVPQLGTVRVGNNVEIGANTTVDRGALDDTVIEEGVRLDNQIQVAHNVFIGAHTAIAACTGIAGSTRIGRRCMIGGGTGIGSQLVIADDIIITGFGMVSHSLQKPGVYSSVLPVEEVRVWRRIVARFKRLDVLASRVRKLEAAAGLVAGRENDD